MLQQPDLTSLSARVTGRHTSMFAGDCAMRSDELASVISGRNVLVIGGAGSIGGAAVRELLRLAPSSLHVVDHNENGLAEIARDLRNRGVDTPQNFQLLPLDFGGPAARRLAQRGGFDIVLNFAALKHVRSEKDVLGVLELLETNVLKQARFLEWLVESSPPTHYFAVSTDKAANPVSFMGATKRAMEHALFTSTAAHSAGIRVTSARFANVAFSAGSLLESWLVRLRQGQPLAVPRDTRRFFISAPEAAEICLLALLAPAQHVLVPRLHAESDLLAMEHVAESVLKAFGLQPERFHDEAAARSAALAGRLDSYPLLITPRDTDGEKAYEEFVGHGEAAVEVGFASAVAVPYVPAPPGEVQRFLSAVDAALLDSRIVLEKGDLGSWLSALIPSFQPISTGRRLDDRM